jgi:hypothetical protein
MDGPTATRAIRALGFRGGLHINYHTFFFIPHSLIFFFADFVSGITGLTGQVQLVDREIFLESGANLVLSKQLDMVFSFVRILMSFVLNPSMEMVMCNGATNVAMSSGDSFIMQMCMALPALRLKVPLLYSIRPFYLCARRSKY